MYALCYKGKWGVENLPTMSQRCLQVPKCPSHFQQFCVEWLESKEAINRHYGYSRSEDKNQAGAERSDARKRAVT